MNDIVWDAEAYVCDDCYKLIGSGDLSSFDYWYGDDAETKRQELYANIESGPLMPKAEVRAPDGSVWTQAHGKLHITLGIFREQHACATNYTVTTTLADGTSTTEDIRSDETYLDDVLTDVDGLLALEIGDSITITRRELQTVSEQGGECACETDTSRSDACASCGQYLQHATMYAVTVWEGNS